MPATPSQVWATGMGLAAGVIVAVLMLATVGVMLGFVAAWTCVPAHSPDPNAAGCSPAALKLRLAGVAALCLLPAWPAFALTRRRLLGRGRAPEPVPTRRNRLIG